MTAAISSAKAEDLSPFTGASGDGPSQGDQQPICHDAEREHRTSPISAGGSRVNGHRNPRVGGHENCALAAMRTAR